MSHVPLSRAALCLECEAVFLLAQTCPACGGEIVMALESWLGTTKAPTARTVEAPSAAHPS